MASVFWGRELAWTPGAAALAVAGLVLYVNAGAAVKARFESGLQSILLQAREDREGIALLATDKASAVMDYVFKNERLKG